MQQSGGNMQLESEMDMNEVNFNLIKNSNAFKPNLSKKNRQEFTEILGEQPTYKMGQGMLGRRSEEDSWFMNN
jgi:hypothetical protein